MFSSMKFIAGSISLATQPASTSPRRMIASAVSSAWLMQPDGTYEQLRPEHGNGTGSLGTHATLMRLAQSRHAL